MAEAVIIDAVRTPLGRGKPGGALHGVHPVDLLAHPLAAVVERSGIDADLIDDVIVGVVSQVGEQSVNIARRGALAAGYPERVPATTVDRQCGSSQQAIHFAAQGILAGSYDVVVAGGVESMSRVPMGSSAAGRRPRRRTVPGALPRRSGAAGHGRRADRRQVGHRAGGARPVRPHLAGAGGRRARSRCVRPRDRADQGGRARRRARRGDDGRGHPGVDARGAGPPRPGVRERLGERAVPADPLERHRRQLVAAHRRRCRGARDQRGESAPSSACARGPASTRWPSRETTRCTCSRR